MEATAKNEKTARDIINVLAESGCSVKEAFEILDCVHFLVQKHSIVQKVNEKLFDAEKDA
jgi:hypothetical protein